VFGLVVRFDLKDGSGEVFDALTSEVVALINEAEPGTLVYACHALEGDAEARVFYELYRDKEAFEEHEHQEHVRRFHEKKAPYLSGEPRVEFLSLQLGKGTPRLEAQRQ
jgi:quinol monooxygenase YgiN